MYLTKSIMKLVRRFMELLGTSRNQLIHNYSGLSTATHALIILIITLLDGRANEVILLISASVLSTAFIRSKAYYWLKNGSVLASFTLVFAVGKGSSHPISDKFSTWWELGSGSTSIRPSSLTIFSGINDFFLVSSEILISGLLNYFNLSTRILYYI